MKKIFILLMLGMFLISFASAAAPQAGGVGALCDIAYPAYEYTKQDTTFALDIHVYDTFQELRTTDGSCYLDIYDSAGAHVIDNYLMVITDMEYKATILGGNFSRLGIYNFRIDCNGTYTDQAPTPDEDFYGGCFVNGLFEVTETGKENPSDNVMVFLMIFALAVQLFMLWSLLKILEAFAKVEGSINTIALGFGAYVLNLALYYYLLFFFPMNLMLRLSFIGISAFGVTHLFLPLIALIFTWIKTGGTQ